jgi:phosphatidate cytidylyltransferase
MSTAMGAIYIGVLMSQIVALRFWDNGLWYVLWGLLVTWANDTFAYFIGVTLGRHKLWPRLSPKKTWEGTVGGWLAAAVVGSWLAVAMPLPIGYIFGAIVGFLAGVLALFGDLAVSMMKRQVGIKDSGTLFPGHGGMLDRLDSLLFTLPFIYQMVFLFGR